MLSYKKLRAWAKNRHPNQGAKWSSDKYWQTIGGDNWLFATPREGKNPMRLHINSATPILRHVKVKSKACPFDGNLIYSSSRIGSHPKAAIRISTNTVQLRIERDSGLTERLILSFRLFEPTENSLNCVP
jgi:RNA-directed DNA polymerase